MSNKRLFRSQNRMVAGVCAGIAEYFDLDPTIVRVIFAILLCGYGSGLLVYLVMWIIVPEKIY
ncbi:MAG: PspC domain-containing protein [Mangrovibacterium sp.]